MRERINEIGAHNDFPKFDEIEKNPLPSTSPTRYSPDMPRLKRIENTERFVAKSTDREIRVIGLPKKHGEIVLFGNADETIKDDPAA